MDYEDVVNDLKVGWELKQLVTIIFLAGLVLSRMVQFRVLSESWLPCSNAS